MQFGWSTLIYYHLTLYLVFIITITRNQIKIVDAIYMTNNVKCFSNVVSSPMFGFILCCAWLMSQHICETNLTAHVIVGSRHTHDNLTYSTYSCQDISKHIGTKYHNIVCNSNYTFWSGFRIWLNSKNPKLIYLKSNQLRWVDNKPTGGSSFYVGWMRGTLVYHNSHPLLRSAQGRLRKGTLHSLPRFH